METWELIGMLFQRPSMYATSVTNFLLLAYLYAETWTADKNDLQLPPPVHTRTGIIGLKNTEFSRRNPQNIHFS